MRREVQPFMGELRVYERINISLCNDTWRLQFMDVEVKVLTQLDFYDHYHILVSLKNNKQEIGQIFKI